MLSESLPDGSGYQLLGSVVPLVVVAPLFWRAFHRSRERVGGGDQMRMFRRALKTGEVPRDADRERWLSLLGGIEESRRTTSWFYLTIGAVIVVLNVALFLQVDERGDPRWIATFLGIIAVGVLVYPGIPVLIHRRQHRRAEDRRRALEGD